MRYSSEIAPFRQGATVTIVELADGALVPTTHVESRSAVKRGAA